jgi:hypothetical protein
MCALLSYYRLVPHHQTTSSPSTCREIGAEGGSVANRVAEISGDPNTSGASWFVAPSIVVRWPTAWLATSEEEAAELSKLKGEFEALEQASALKRCGLSFKRQSG